MKNTFSTKFAYLPLLSSYLFICKIHCRGLAIFFIGVIHGLIVKWFRKPINSEVYCKYREKRMTSRKMNLSQRTDNISHFSRANDHTVYDIIVLNMKNTTVLLNRTCNVNGQRLADITIRECFPGSDISSTA